MYYCNDQAFGNAVYDSMIAAGQAADVTCRPSANGRGDIHLPTAAQLMARLRPADLMRHREILVACEQGDRLEERWHLPACLAEEEIDTLVAELDTDHNIQLQGGGDALWRWLEHHDLAA